MTLRCFSLVDFNKSGGATIRISGILNALVKNNVTVNLYTTANKIDELDQEIALDQLNNKALFTKFEKRVFQFLLAYFPIWITNVFFRKQLDFYKSIFNNSDEILFFEYLDITIGYWLKKNKVLKNYYTDVHGVAAFEFELNETKSFKTKLSNKVKKDAALRLDKKIYKNSSLVLYPSSRLETFMNKSNNISIENSIVLSESINNNLVQQTIDKSLQTTLIKEYKLVQKEAVLLFAGAFKALGGVVDLIKAYIKLREENNVTTCLILVGDGPLYNYCKELAENSNFKEEIHFLGRQPYNKLKTYQSIADIIICPDKDTPYSQILPHIKYFDSLVSGKIVINGKFEFSNELNPNEVYSLDFIPSDINSLTYTMLKSIKNKDALLKKYSLASELAIENFSYEKNVQDFVQFLKQQDKSAKNFGND